MAGSERLDLNTADREALAAIEGIGGHAHDIVRYREERGGFASVDQLDEVPGFTGKLREAVRARLFVAGGTGSTLRDDRDAGT